MSYYGGGGGWGPPPNVGAPGQRFYTPNQGQMPPQQQQIPGYFPPAGAGFTQAQDRTQYGYVQAGYGNYGHPPPPTVTVSSSTAPQPSAPGMIGTTQSAQYTIPPPASKQTSAGDARNRARSSPERSRDSYSPPRRRSPTPDDRYERRSSGTRGRDDVLDDYRYRPSERRGRKSPSQSPDGDRHYSMESRSRRKSPEVFQDKVRKSRRDVNDLPKEILQKSRSDQSGVDIDSLLKDERLRNVLFAGISKATAKLEQSLKEKETNDDISFLSASASGEKSHLFPLASSSTGSQQKLRSILKRKPDPDEGGDVNKTFSHLSTLEKTLHMLRGKPDMGDSSLSSEQSQMKVDSKSHGALGQLSSYDDENDEESYLYGDRKESFEKKKKRSAVHPFWSVDAVNVNEDNKELETFEMKEKLFEKWRQSIQKSPDRQSIPPKDMSRDRVFEKSHSTASHVSPVQGNKDDGQEELDSTVQNILQSIGFDFDLSQRMQQLARKKKFQEVEKSAGISNQSASFLGKGHNLSEELKASLLQSGNDLSQIDSLLQEARASARRDRATRQSEDSISPVGRSRRDRSPDVDRAVSIKDRLKGRHSPSEWSDQDEEPRRLSRQRPSQNYEPLSPKESFFNEDRMLRPALHISKSVREDDVRDEYFYPEKDPVDLPPGVPLLTSYSSRQKNEDLSSGLLKSMRVENFRVMSKPVYDDDNDEFTETRRVILPARSDRNVLSRSPSAKESRSPSLRGTLKRSGSPLSVLSLKERRIISSQSGSLWEGRLKSPDYNRDNASLSDQRRPSTGYRSPSPRDARRSPSPRGSRRSPSPRGSRRSPSPRISRRSPSPRGSRRSPSPRISRRSLSPRGSWRSPSPRGSRRSPSPRGARRSPSPRGSRRSRSPRGSRRSPSARGSKYHPRRRSRSPDGQRPKSPRRYRSRSPVRHRSRSPRRRRSRSNSRPRFRDMRSPRRVVRPKRKSPEKNNVRNSDSKISVDKKATATVKRDGITTKGKGGGQSQNVASVDCSKMTDEERKVHLQKLLAEKNVGSTPMLQKNAEMDCQNILESFEKLAPTISLEKKADMINKLTQLSEKDRSKVSSNVNERFAKVMALKFEVVKFKKQQNELMRKSQRSGKGKEDPQLFSNERAQLKMEREIQRLSALELEVEIKKFSVGQEEPSETRQARVKTSGNLITVPVSDNETATSKTSEKTSFTQNAASVLSKSKDGKKKAPPTTDVPKDARKEPDAPSSSNTNTWKTVDVKDELPNISDGKASQGVDKKGKSSKSGSKSTPSTSTKKKIYYEYIDSGNHFCRHCHITCNTLSQFFEHAHGKKHAREILELPSPWDDVKNVKAENRKVGQAQSRRVKGTEMMFPVNGFYCCLCKLYCGDFQIAEKHLKSDTHYDKYLDYIRDNPKYEKNLLLEKTKDPTVVSSKKKSSSEDKEGKGREKKAHLRVKTEKDLEKEDEDTGTFDKIGSVDMELDEDDHRDDDMDVESKVPKMVPKPPPPFVPPPPPEPAYEDSMRANKEDEVQPLDTFLSIKSEDTDKAVEGEKIPVVKSRAALDVSHIPMPPIAVTSPVVQAATRKETLITVKSLQEVQAEENKTQEAERKAMEEEKRMMGIDVDAEEEKPLAAIKRPPMLQNLPVKPSEANEAQKEPVKPPSIDSLFAKLNKNVAHKRKPKLVSAVEPERNEMEMRIQQEIAAKVNKEKEKLARKKQKEEERERRKEEKQFQKKKTYYSDLSSSEDSDSEESAAEDGTVSGENKHQVLPSETVTAEAPNATQSGTETQSVSDNVDSSITSTSLSIPADATHVEPATEVVESRVVTGLEENVSVEPQESVLTESTDDVMMKSEENIVKESQTSVIAESEDNEAETKEKNLAESVGDEVTSVVEAPSDGAEIQRQTRSTSSSQTLRKGKAPGKKKSSPPGAAKTSESDLFEVFSTSLETVSRDAKKKLAKKSPARKRGRGAKSRQPHEELRPEEREIDMADFVVLSEITDEDDGSVGAMAAEEPGSATQPGLEVQEDAGLSQELLHDKVQIENNEHPAKSDQENLLNVSVELLQSEDGKNERPIEDMEVVDIAVKAPFAPLGDDAQEVTIEHNELEAKQPTESAVPAPGRGGRRGRGRKSGGRGRGRGKRGGKSQPVVEKIVTPETEDRGTIRVESRKLEETESSAVESNVEKIESSAVGSTMVGEIESSAVESTMVGEIENSAIESTMVGEIENNAVESTMVGKIENSAVESTMVGEIENSAMESTMVGEIENNAVESTMVGEIENSAVESTMVGEIENSAMESTIVGKIENSAVESTMVGEIENSAVESTMVGEIENSAVESTMVGEIENSAVESTMVGEIENSAVESTMVGEIENSTVESKEEESQNDASQAKTDEKERSTGRPVARRTRRGRAAATPGRVTRSRLSKKQSEPVGDESIISEPEMIEVEEKDSELSVVATSVTSDETDDVNMNMTSRKEMTETIPDVFKDSTNEDVITKDGSDSDATITEDSEDIALGSPVSSSYTGVPRADDDIVPQDMQNVCQAVPIPGQSMDISQGQMGNEFLANPNALSISLMTMEANRSALSSGLMTVDSAQSGHDAESSSWNLPSLDDLGQESQSALPVDMPVLQEFVPHLASSVPNNQPRDPPMSGIVSEVDAPDTVVMEMDDDLIRQEGQGLECDYDECLPTSGLSLGLEAVSDSMSFPLEDDNAKTDSMEPLSSE